jgi:hypothetical protein
MKLCSGIGILFLIATFSFGPASAAQRSTPLARVTHVFCDHGGVGIWPDNEPSPYYAIVVVDIDLPVAAQSMLEVSKFALGDAGSDKASLKNVESIVKLEVVPPSPQDATYENPAGVPVTAPLPAGVTRIRVRVRLDHVPNLGEVQLYRMTLTGLGEPVTVTGTGCHMWPT